MPSVSVCFSPALYPFYAMDNAITVVVDIFRATTSICVAFQNGAKAVKTVDTLKKAKNWQQQGFLVAAERKVKKVDFADFGNSPFDFTEEKVKGQTIVFTTTNGTQVVESALQSDEIVIGAFVNMLPLLDYCIGQEKNVIVLCSGWNNKFCIEDTLFAGAFAKKLLQSTRFRADSDATFAAIQLWNFAESNPFEYICNSEHYKRLVENGLEDSVKFCFTENLVQTVPIFDKANKQFIKKTT